MNRAVVIRAAAGLAAWLCEHAPGTPHVVIGFDARRDAVARAIPDKEVMSVGRDGASDAIAFMAAGIPAVEFGPDGAGHHGPEEWVSISSMARYRRSLVSFVRMLPIWLERPAPEATATEAGGVVAEEPRSGLTAIEGGRA